MTTSTALSIMFIAVIIGIGVFFSNSSSNNSTTISGSKSSSDYGENSSTVESTFYTQSVANVRSCPSTDCESLGTYPVNTDLTFSYATFADLPQWIEFSFPDSDGVNQTGYINKITLGTSKLNDNQVCESSYGSNSMFTGQKNSTGGLTCGCKNGYEWNDTNSFCNLIKIQPVASPNLQQQLVLEQVGGLQGYAGGPLYHVLITNSGPWNEYNDASMKILLSPYVCTVNMNVQQMNNGYPVSFSLKTSDTGKTFFVTFGMGDCNKYLW